jgi:glycosyltransferase involved in cell wall biosynthesis
MNNLKKSMLNPWKSRVIPNGVDTEIFNNLNKYQARSILGLPKDAFICLFVAHMVDGNHPHKDVETVINAVKSVGDKNKSMDLKFIGVGKSSHVVQNPNLIYPGFINDPKKLAMYYQSSNVLLHAANADNLPVVILEAMACGLPVIATGVGGIPEQVIDGLTGYIVPRGDSETMANKIIVLIQQPELRKRMEIAALEFVKTNYCLDKQSEIYIRWFEQLLEDYRTMNKF